MAAFDSLEITVWREIVAPARGDHVAKRAEEIRVDCVEALQRYITEATKTCHLLMAVERFPVEDIHLKIEMLEQRRENEAQLTYQ